MESYDLVDIDKNVLKKIREHSCADAPWMAMGMGALDFLEAGIEAGLKWKTHHLALVAFVESTSKAGAKRQEQARRDISWAANMGMYPSGILLFDEYEAGRWRGDEDSDDRFLEQDPNLPGQDHILAKLMEVYWPDIPPLAWNRLRDLLVRREFEDRKGYCSEDRYARDYLDFGKAYLALSHVNKLQPQQVMDWEKITHMPGAGRLGPKP